MPAYGTLTNPPALYGGDSSLTFNAEQPASATFSQEFAISPNADGTPPSVSVSVQFAAAPGTFEFDVYESDVDVVGNYIQVPTNGQINSVSSTNFARVDIQPFMGNFIAIFCKTQNANAVNATVRITRRG
jgi:hypothetical protein